MQMKTRKIVIRTVLGLCVFGLGPLISNRIAATHTTGWIAAGWALSALAVLRVGIALRQAAIKLRAATADGVTPAKLYEASIAASPSWTHGIYAMEKRAYRYFWRSLSRAPFDDAGRFSVAHGAQGGKRTVSLLLTVALCGMAIGYSLPHYLSAFWPLFGGYAGLAVGVIYALVWIVGERRSLKEAGHRVNSERLILDVGLRADARIDLISIAACVAIGGRARRDFAWRFTPGEKTNVALDVKDAFDAVVRGTPRRLEAGRVLLYVDDPASLVAAVNRAMAADRLTTGQAALRASSVSSAPSPTATLAGVD